MGLLATFVAGVMRWPEVSRAADMGCAVATGSADGFGHSV